MIEIYENFLSGSKYKSLYEVMRSDQFPWYKAPSMTHSQRPDIKAPLTNKETSLLFHRFYFRGDNYISSTFNFLLDYFPFLNNIDLNCVRANLICPSGFDLRHTPYHNDVLTNGLVRESSWVAIYYLHGSASPTIFKTGLLSRKLIFPKNNRLVVFPNRIKHAMYLPAKKDRMVINFNFLNQHPIKSYA